MSMCRCDTCHRIIDSDVDVECVVEDDQYMCELCREPTSDAQGDE